MNPDNFQLFPSLLLKYSLHFISNAKLPDFDSINLAKCPQSVDYAFWVAVLHQCIRFTSQSPAGKK